VQDHPQFVRPEGRYNELKSLLEQPLPEYLCITRPKSRVQWGIPVPFSADHVVYVWFDALLNYLTVPRYLERDREDLWPPDVHFIGKDILRHHAVYWPIMLHELGLPDDQMPRMIFAHGWWRIGEQKMSKSLGNIVDPSAVVGGLLKDQPYAADAYRYFLLREIPFGQDGSFSEEAILKRLNTDLGNDLGNLVNRTLSMIEKYLEGRAPVLTRNELSVIGGHRALADAATALSGSVQAAMDRVEFSVALEAIMALASRANQYIEQAAPWKLAAHANGERQLHEVLGVLAEVLRILSVSLEPFMPSVARAIWRQLGLPGEPKSLSSAQWSKDVGSRPIAGEHPVLFPRMEAVG
jgi:methionyl-tRNA synthetase